MASVIASNGNVTAVGVVTGGQIATTTPSMVTFSSDSSTLQGKLDAKQDAATLATVATSGSYNDLTDKPVIRYAFSTITVSSSTVTVDDGNVNSLTGISSALTVVLPAPISGYARDFTVRLTQPATAVAITWSTTDAGSASVSFLDLDDSKPFAAMTGGTQYEFYFSECAQGVFRVTRKTLTALSQ